MANIEVDWEELNKKGELMVDESSNMETILGNIKKEITNLNETWHSNSAEQMIGYINGVMTTTFENYKKVVEEYGKYLQEASERYSETEANLTGEANKMLNFE